MEKQIIISWEEVLKKLENISKEFAFAEQSKANVALFGAGRVAKGVLKQLRDEGYNVSCFIDNSIEKQGKDIDGVPIVSLDDAIVAEVKFIIITVRQNVQAIKKQLSNYANISFDEWFIVKNIDKYKDIYENILHDTDSQRVLGAILLGCLTGDRRYYSAVSELNQYFALPEFIDVGVEHFVDIGSYVGDTVEKFIWLTGGLFQKIYAFEPGDKQFVALEKRVARLLEEWALAADSISIIRAGIGEKNAKASFDISFTEALQSVNLKINEDKESGVQIYSLDSVMGDKPVTFIKADIEGMEMDMLKGAKNIIVQNKPKMALCVYHNIGDLFDIISFVREIESDYKFALRHHTSSQSETVLYCWVEKDE